MVSLRLDQGGAAASRACSAKISPRPSPLAKSRIRPNTGRASTSRGLDRTRPIIRHFTHPGIKVPKLPRSPEFRDGPALTTFLVHLLREGQIASKKPCHLPANLTVGPGEAPREGIGAAQVDHIIIERRVGLELVQAEDRADLPQRLADLAEQGGVPGPGLDRPLRPLDDVP